MDGEISLQEVLEGADGLINILTQSGILKPKDANTPAPSSASATDPQKNPEPANPAQFTRIYQFSSLDLVCEAARQTGAVFNGSSVLYKNPENGVFYLILRKEDDDELSFSRVCNTLSEYGTRLKGDAAASRRLLCGALRCDRKKRCTEGTSELMISVKYFMYISARVRILGTQCLFD